MSFFDALFGRRSGGGQDAERELRFSSRGEGITYRAGGREMEIGFAAAAHTPSILTNTITKWKDGSPLTEDEKSSLFAKLFPFLKHDFQRKPIVVINTDDPSRALWERLCGEHHDAIARIEYTSDREEFDRLRQLISGIPAGKGGLVIDGVKLSDPAAIDAAFEELRRRRRE